MFKKFIITKLDWARGNQLFWANAALIFATLLILWFPGPSDLRIRLWGMALQLLGAFTVWHDLAGAARDFGVTGIVKRNLAWVKRGFRNKSPVNGSAEIILGSLASSSSGTVRATLHVGASLEERVSMLERRLRQVDDAAVKAQNLINEKERLLRQKIAQLEQSLVSKVEEVNLKLKTAVVGSYPVLLFGAAWLVVGIVLSSVAPEVAKSLEGEWVQIWRNL